MSPFKYASATSPEDAISLVGSNGRYLGGGIDLLGELKEFIVSPDILVDVKNLRYGPGRVRKAPIDTHSITSQTTVSELSVDPDIKAKFPGLIEAASEIGSPQIRNVATIGGNLLQHSRCLYYRQPDITCLKRGGETCYAQEGENKYSALFSGCACITAFTSNLGVMLTALDATCVVQTKVGQFSFPKMAELYEKAWKDPLLHNSLISSDLFVGLYVPTTRIRSAYRQVSEKSEFDWALVSCAAAGNVAGGRITEARVALGAVAPVPYIVEEANQFLEGKELTADDAGKAADILLRNAKPLAHNGYKVPLAHALIRRTLLALNS